MRRVWIAAASAVTLLLAGGIVWNPNATPMGLPSHRTTQRLRKSVAAVPAVAKGPIYLVLTMSQFLVPAGGFEPPTY